MSPQDPPPQVPSQARRRLQAVPKRRVRRRRIQPDPTAIEPIPGPDGNHARVVDSKRGLIVTWVPATPKPGYSVGDRYVTGLHDERILAGTYEIPTTVTLPDGTVHIIDEMRIAGMHVHLYMDSSGALASATYKRDQQMTYPDGTPLLGQAHHDRVAAYRSRRP